MHAATTAAAQKPAKKTSVASARPAAPVIELCRGLQGMRGELYGHALRLSRSTATAEDLVQDTVERAIRFQHTFQSGTSLRAWAHQILFSIFISRCRRRKLERNALDVLATSPGAWTLPEQRPESIALSPPVARALDSLPAVFRSAVVLVDLEEMAYKDAATLLGVPVGTVMSRLHRGRAMLAERMRAGGEAERAAA
jgi:RNA polymerase sigma-70 factor, ECF subfamily